MKSVFFRTVLFLAAAIIALAALPAAHSDTAEKALVYKIEPYVLAGDVYAGETITLASRASIPAEGTLEYQWYSTDVNDMATVRAIDGATDSTYDPPLEEGTMYYCVGMRNVRGAEQSTVSYSRLVEVNCFTTVREHFHDFSGPCNFFNGQSCFFVSHEPRYY